jgi:hypothetical protein
MHSLTGRYLENLIRFRYNTMAYGTPRGEWKCRVILERDRGFEEVLAHHALRHVPSFSREDDRPVVGREYQYHMACYGVFRQKDGIGTIDAR